MAGLEARGCQNTRGDGQTLCVMSDSYDFLGGAADLQASGDLPPVVEVVKVCDDLGSAQASVRTVCRFPFHCDFEPDFSNSAVVVVLGAALFANFHRLWK